jgi:hypothetical protein
MCRKVNRGNRMGYTGGKDVMEVCNVVCSGESHNAYSCVFAHKGFFLLLVDMNKRLP